ncbi:MAG: serine/threonine-protein kinase [Nannocystaceae bacterium]|nr:serine/threonine-protein kinase [Nannocystaceae bacterium]
MGDALSEGSGSIAPSDAWLHSVAGALGAASTRASAWIASGTIVDDSYRVERPLGAGGMAVVYLAHDLQLDRRVALKLYDVDARELSLSRIWREARAMAQLSHPNVVVVHGIGAHRGRVFLAMEFVAGQTLRGWLAQARRPWPEVLAMFVACARGLAAAHAVGLAHGDFKPDNVLVGSDGRPRVADFGLAHGIGGAWERGGGEGGPSTDRGTTTARTSGQVVGTRGYAAPELERGAAVDERCDQFSFCVALYEALFGLHPFEGDDDDARRRAMSHGRMRARPAAAVPARIHQALARGLSLDPAARFASLDALILALTRDPSRWRARIGFGAVTLVGTAALALTWPRAPGCDRADEGLDGSWGAQREAALREQLRASGSPIAAQTHAQLAQGLDDWTDRWRAQRIDACEATRVRGAQSDLLLDRRMRCLDRMRARLDAALAVLEAADRDLVARAPDVVAALPDPAACGDVDRLLAQIAPPGDPALAQAVEDERRVLGDAWVAGDFGRFAEAAEQATRVRDGGTAREYPPLRAEASLVLGIAQWRAQENAAGEAALTEAFHGAIASGDDETAAAAARELLCTLGQVPDSTARAQWWAAMAASIAARAGEGIELRLERRACEGWSLFAAGRYAEAEAVYRGAIAEAAAVPDSAAVPQLYDRLGSLLASIERHAEAAQEHQRAIELATALRGPEHPLVLAARGNLAGDLLRLGRAGAALSIELEVLQSRLARGDPRSPQLVADYGRIADVLDALGALPQAMAYRDAGIAIARTRADQARSLVVLLANQASDLHTAGRLDQGLALLAEAVAMSETAAGPTHPDTGKARINLGSLLSQAGRIVEAEAELRRGLAILEPAYGPQHPVLAITHLNLAQIATETGRLELAGSELALAEGIAAAAGDPQMRAFVALSRADVERARHDVAAARQLQRTAVALLHGVDPLTEGRAVLYLAYDDLALGELAAAREGFDHARALAREQGAAARAADALLGLARTSWAQGHHASARRQARDAQAEFATLQDDAGVETCRRWLEEHR